MKFKQKISEEIFKQKYMINGETSVDQVFRGISQEVASVEKTKWNTKKVKEWNQVFYSEISLGNFLPAGRITANARPENHLRKNLLNCYVIPIEDSINGITLAIQEYMKILSMGGGVGLNFSSLRPKGAFVSNGGETTGPLPFADIFNRASETISLGGGRRGASIMVLNVDHPDIEEFITYKQGNNLQKFNISVGITDVFMDAVNNDLDWDLQFKGKVYKTVKAKKLYNLIMKNAYMNNEPGIFNLDHVNNTNNGYYMYEIEAPNPCLVGESVLKTKMDGLEKERTLEEVVNCWKKGKEIEVLSFNGKTEWKKVEWGDLTREKTETITIFTEEGKTVELTPDHFVFTRNKGWVMAKNLNEGDDIESID